MHNSLNLYQDSESRVSDLKKILFSDELEDIFARIDKLQDRINSVSSDEFLQGKIDQLLIASLQHQLETKPQTISKLFEPVLINMISASANKQSDKMIDLLSEFLIDSLILSKQKNLVKAKDLATEIVSIAFENSSSEVSQKTLTENLSPYVGNALKNQIQNEKETIVDVLYPIIGTMISKFIKKAFADLNERINVQIENANPIKNILRKFKSKVYGVNESEILFQERLQGKIKSIYLIHRSTGVVVSSAHSEKALQDEANSNLIGGMFSAITSFVNDWIENGQEHADLSEINYGDSKIYFESSGSLITAVVIEGNLTYYLKSNIQKFMQTLVLEHNGYLRDFQGDLSAVPDSVQKQINNTLSLNSNLEKKVDSDLDKKYLVATCVTLLFVVSSIFYYF